MPSIPRFWLRQDFQQFSGREIQHMPTQVYYRECTDQQRRLMYQIVRSFLPNNIEAAVPYHAMVIFDFYFTTLLADERASIIQRLGNGENNETLQQLNKAENSGLRNVAIACVILSLKFVGGYINLQPLIQTLQEHATNIDQITATERRIFDYLDLQPRSLIVTAMSFVLPFMEVLQTYVPVDQDRVAPIVNRAIGNIHNSHVSINITRFRPSVIAAAAILTARRDIVGENSFFEAIIFFMFSGSPHNDGLGQCVDEMRQVLLGNGQI